MDDILILGIFLYVVVFVAFPRIGYQPVRVLSGSMEPGIREGDLVFIRQCETKDVSAGDVISYETSNGGFVLHRVLKKTEEGFITKGDANEKEDFFPVTMQSFRGKLVIVIPKGGEWFEKISSRKTIWILCCYGAGRGLYHFLAKKRTGLSR